MGVKVSSPFPPLPNGPRLVKLDTGPRLVQECSSSARAGPILVELDTHTHADSSLAASFIASLRRRHRNFILPRLPLFGQYVHLTS